MKGKQYAVEVCDRAGCFKETACSDLSEMLDVVVEMTRRYPDSVVVCWNRDKVDVDTNGLTEDEKDAVFGAIWDARQSVDIGRR